MSADGMALLITVFRHMLDGVRKKHLNPEATVGECVRQYTDTELLDEKDLRHVIRARAPEERKSYEERKRSRPRGDGGARKRKREEQSPRPKRTGVRSEETRAEVGDVQDHREKETPTPRGHMVARRNETYKGRRPWKAQLNFPFQHVLRLLWRD